MQSLSLVSRVLDKLKYLVFKQELVGIDQLGNKYYRCNSFHFGTVFNCPVRRFRSGVAMEIVFWWCSGILIPILMGNQWRSES